MYRAFKSNIEVETNNINKTFLVSRKRAELWSNQVQTLLAYTKSNILPLPEPTLSFNKSTDTWQYPYKKLRPLWCKVTRACLVDTRRVEAIYTYCLATIIVRRLHAKFSRR